MSNNKSRPETMIARLERDKNGLLWADCVSLEQGSRLEVLTVSANGAAGWIETEVTADDTGAGWLAGVLDKPEGLYARLSADAFI